MRLRTARPPLEKLFIALVLIFVSAVVCSHEADAHPEDDFCQVGAGVDPALCRALADANNGEGPQATPLVNDDGVALSALETARVYVGVGARHILPGGADHILFVLALFLASERLRSLIIQISAFTVAHSVTLGLAAAGVIEPPTSMVEPLIALSITLVALENLFLREIPSWRPAVVFGFGLFHGLGFAGFIRDVGLPPDQFWSSLIGFNVGVEIGQLAVVLAAILIRVPLKRLINTSGFSYRTAIVVPLSAMIGAISFWWALSRALGH